MTSSPVCCCRERDEGCMRMKTVFYLCSCFHPMHGTIYVKIKYIFMRLSRTEESKEEGRESSSRGSNRGRMKY